MKVDVLLGLQWGDEGKGKVVDVLTPNYDVITRFQGGPNAGHTLEFNGEKYILRSIPSGIFQGGKVNVIGNGVVLDPLLFKQEAEALAASGHDLTKQLCISKKAHLILPTLFSFPSSLPPPPPHTAQGHDHSGLSQVSLPLTVLSLLSTINLLCRNQK